MGAGPPGHVHVNTHTRSGQEQPPLHSLPVAMQRGEGWTGGPPRPSPRLPPGMPTAELLPGPHPVAPPSALPPYLVPALQRPLPLLEQVAFLPLGHDTLCPQPVPRLLHHLPQLGGLQSRTKGEGVGSGEATTSVCPLRASPPALRSRPLPTLRPAGHCWALPTECSRPGREGPTLGSPWGRE